MAVPVRHAIGMEDFSEPEDAAIDMAAGLDTLIGRMVMGSAANPGDSKEIEASAFYCSQTPPITPAKFAERLAEYLHCSPEAFVVASIFVWRLHEVMPSLFCHSTTHKIMLASAVCGAKWTDDKFFTNSYYAEVGGVPQRTLNKCERELAMHLRFGFFVIPEQFGKMRSHLRAFVFASKSEEMARAKRQQLEAEHEAKKLRVSGEWHTGSSATDLLAGGFGTAGSFSTELASVNVDDFLVGSRYGEEDTMRGMVAHKPRRNTRTSKRSPYALIRKNSWFDVLPSLADVDGMSEFKEISEEPGIKEQACPASPAPERIAVCPGPAKCFAPVLCCSDRPANCDMGELVLI